VKDGDLVAAAERRLHEVAADELGAADGQDAHSENLRSQAGDKLSSER
jgi:hypothetical protein